MWIASSAAIVRLEEHIAGVEFPIRGTTTVSELEELYGLTLDAEPHCTLDALIRDRFAADHVAIGSHVILGGAVLTVRAFGPNGVIEQVGLAILP